MLDGYTTRPHKFISEEFLLRNLHSYYILIEDFEILNVN